MTRLAWKYVFLIMASAVGLSLWLWSWNTLATLFSWPEAEARHALAALVMLVTIRHFFALRAPSYGEQNHDADRPSD